MPGLIIPTQLRNNWGYSNFGIFYERAVNELKDCQKLKEYIGTIKANALVEGNNFKVEVFMGGGDFAQMTIELVGEKGTAIVRTCYSKLVCPESDPQFPVQYGIQVYSKSGKKNLPYPQKCRHSTTSEPVYIQQTASYVR